LKLKLANEEKQKNVEDDEKKMLALIDQLVNSVGNIVHDSVVISNDEKDN
jgi:hypothetical protein